MTMKSRTKMVQVGEDPLQMDIEISNPSFLSVVDVPENIGLSYTELKKEYQKDLLKEYAVLENNEVLEELINEYVEDQYEKDNMFDMEQAGNILGKAVYNELRDVSDTERFNALLISHTLQFAHAHIYDETYSLEQQGDLDTLFDVIPPDLIVEDFETVIDFVQKRAVKRGYDDTHDIADDLEALVDLRNDLYDDHAEFPQMYVDTLRRQLLIHPSFNPQ